MRSRSSPGNATPGAVAPDFRAPTSKGHTLGPESFSDRLAVVLVFLDGIGTSEEQTRLWGFDAALPEFGRRRVQLLGVVPSTARDLREASHAVDRLLAEDPDAFEPHPDVARPGSTADPGPRAQR